MTGPFHKSRKFVFIQAKFDLIPEFGWQFVTDWYNDPSLLEHLELVQDEGCWMSCVEMVSYTCTFTLAGWREFAFEMTAAAPTRRTRRGVSELWRHWKAGEWGWTMGIFTLNVEFCTFLVHIMETKKSRPSHTGWFGLVWFFAAGTTVSQWPWKCQHLFFWIMFDLVWCSKHGHSWQIYLNRRRLLYIRRKKQVTDLLI